MLQLEQFAGQIEKKKKKKKKRQDELDQPRGFSACSVRPINQKPRLGLVHQPIKLPKNNNITPYPCIKYTTFLHFPTIFTF